MPRSMPWMWTAFILATVMIPTLIPFLAGIHARFEGISKRSYFRDVASDLWVGLANTSLMFTFLAYQSWLMVDAITRTLWRLLVTRKHMLEWMTAAQAKMKAELDLPGFFLRMAGGGAFAIAAGAD